MDNLYKRLVDVILKELENIMKKLKMSHMTLFKREVEKATGVEIYDRRITLEQTKEQIEKRETYE